MRYFVTTALLAASLLLSPYVPATISYAASSGGHCGEKANDCNHSNNNGNGNGCPGGSCRIKWVGITGR